MNYSTVQINDFEEWLNNKPSDFKDDFLFELNKAFESELNRQVTLDDVLHDLPRTITKVTMVIGEKEGKFVSFVRCIYIPATNNLLSHYRITNDFERCKYILLTTLFVSTKFRRLGKGQELIKKTRNLLYETNKDPTKYWIMLQVYKTNLQALLCYLKSGFEFIDFTINDYLMAIKLNKVDE